MTALSNPPSPAGFKLLKQSAVTPALTAWAVEILHNPGTYPMFATTTWTSGAVTVLARVEWHPPDFQNHAVHRGVTLYGQALTEVDAEGIDVSHYQPVVDWTKVAQAGLHFAFIKATEGTAHIDSSFANHWARAKAAKLLRGAYHFFRPQQDGAAQARLFLAELSDIGELPPVLDVEVMDGVSRVALVTGLSAWLEIVTARVKRPIIYTSSSFWNSLPSMTEIASKADLWVPAWGASAPSAVHGWSNWTFWQHTNKATVPGIAGPVDRSRFFGNVDQLQAYSAVFVGSLAGREQSDHWSTADSAVSLPLG